MLLVLLLASDLWVYAEARGRRSQGAPVVASVGPVTLDRPEHWLAACLLVWIVAFPLYLVARRAD